MNDRPSDMFEVLATPFAGGIYDLLQAVADPALPLTKTQRSRMTEAASINLRKCCDVLVPAARAPEVSVGAAARAQALGVDLRQQTWQTQPTFDPGRRIFHYEHMQPIVVVRAAVAGATSPDDVVQILRREVRLAWITKEEDARLTAKGYAFKRPDPDDAYRQARIELQVLKTW